MADVTRCSTCYRWFPPTHRENGKPYKCCPACREKAVRRSLAKGQACDRCGTPMAWYDGGQLERVCSSCRRREHEKQTTFLCLWCGQQFVNTHHAEPKFCSQACSGMWHRRKKDRADECEACGANLPPGRHSMRRFCSRKCFTRGRERVPNWQTVGRANHGKQWTGIEMELVANREDLTVVQLAEMLGRSVYGVETMRAKVRRNPQLGKIASLP